MTGQKNDAGHKLTKKEKVEHAATLSTTPFKPKVAKQDSMKDPQKDRITAHGNRPHQNSR